MVYEDNSELEKIIRDGKVNSGTAMVVFAIELKNLREKVDELNTALRDDATRYATKEELSNLKAELSQVKTIVYSFIGLIMTAFILGVARLVFK